MLLLHARHHCNGGRYDGAQQRNLPRDVRAHLHHSAIRAPRQRQQRQRRPHLIVQVAGGGVHGKARAECGLEQFLRRCLAVRPADGDDRNGPRRAIEMAERPQRVECVVHDEHRYAEARDA